MQTGCPLVFRLCALATLFVLTPVPSWAQSNPGQPVQAEDLHRVDEIRDVKLSPHGRSVAYTVRSTAVPGLSESSSRTHRTQLYVTRTTGARGPRLLTRNRNPASQPVWHPDGTHLAFVQPVDGTPQVFLLSLGGGTPYQLTDTPHGAQCGCQVCGRRTSWEGAAASGCQVGPGSLDQAYRLPPLSCRCCRLPSCCHSGWSAGLIPPACCPGPGFQHQTL